MKELENRSEFQSNIDSFRGFYEWFEIWLFLDSLCRNKEIFNEINFNIADWDYILDRDMVFSQLKKIHLIKPNDYFWNFYGLLLVWTYKTLFSDSYEIMDNYCEFKNIISVKLWDNQYTNFYEIFKFLRDFWIHNTDPKFRIKESHFGWNKNRLKKLYENWIIEFIYWKKQITDFIFKWDINIKIDLNLLTDWQDIREICTFNEMMQLLRLFYNFCSLCDEL